MNQTNPAPVRTHHREDRDLSEIFRDDPDHAGHQARQINLIQVSPHYSQTCPRHSHATLYETFICLTGDLIVTVDDVAYHLSTGQSVTVPPLSWHKLRASAGASYLEVRSLPFDAQSPDKTFGDADEAEQIAQLNAAASFTGPL